MFTFRASSKHSESLYRPRQLSCIEDNGTAPYYRLPEAPYLTRWRCGIAGSFSDPKGRLSLTGACYKGNETGRPGIKELECGDRGGEGRREQLGQAAMA